MDSIIQILPALEAYKISLISLSLLCLSILIQCFMTAPLAFIKNEQTPGMPIRGDHQLLSFRALRTYSNSVENLPAFGFTLMVAIIVGVKPSLVNLLAIIHLASRTAFWAVYYSGIGKVAGGPRTMCHVVGLTSNIVLVGTCLFAFIRI